MSLKEIKSLRNELHQCPELSCRESETSLRIKDFIKAHHDTRFIEDIGGHGLAAVYEYSVDVFLEFLPKNGVEVTLCDTSDHQKIEEEVKKGCKLLYLESPTNPTLKILDLERLIRIAHENGAMVVVDNIFATPINQQPLAIGADIVLHSATKYLGGHSDAMGGVVCGKKELIRQIFHYREINGASLHANSTSVLSRGVLTLE